MDGDFEEGLKKSFEQKHEGYEERVIIVGLLCTGRSGFDVGGIGWPRTCSARYFRL